LAVNVTRFQQRLSYRTRAPAPHVLRALDQLGQLDADVEGRIRKLESTFWVVIGGGLLCFLITLLSTGDARGEVARVIRQAMLFASMLWLFGLIGVGIVLFQRREALTPHDLDNRRYGLARALLQRLQVDLDPDADVHLVLDLRAPNVPEKLVRKDAQDSEEGWTLRFYSDPWLTLEARMADGAFVRIHMTERLRLGTRLKTSASGRVKAKTKRDGHARLDVSVRVKPKRYPELARMKARLRGATRLPSGVQLVRSRVEADRLSLRARLAEDWVDRREPGQEGRDDASRTATMMLLSLYQVLGYTRRVAKLRRARRARSV
jgi:hypothetical protein